ncbi:MAG: Uma2 family endonuclease [Symplocastrum torsivum CPER-KK1]|jgi:Uma2 family endonuclease|uniref:Uma2 family endonuclease n=1 Tax=Symplocastrum torsivum CPER-KK1 TaxID=450513 RepID=A0A951PQ70_9CYAN|nr:Uma2 family endonuclease [Symplocastrum torsivum CPER-KK1]
MTASVQPSAEPVIVYPDSDGQPMADNTKQFRCITTIQGGLDALFKDNADILVAGDLLWYPVEGDSRIRLAPDVMVVFGRPKGDRGFYQQWREDNIPPQVVFEVLSPGNRLGEMVKKLRFYERYGVEEYYMYDPDNVDLTGWLRSGDELNDIESIVGWVSPRLGIRLELSSELEIYRPDGQKFLTYVELERQREQERQQKELAQSKVERLAQRLRSMGVNPDEV